jgi:catechol 2,3-dioxygenase-like lactoylglutathione lyase family enzyme
MSIEGISHITFIVRDLDQMSRFLCDGLDAQEVYDSIEKNFSISREKFFVLAGYWIAVMEGQSPLEKTYQHIAFKVGASKLSYYEQKLKALGVEFKPTRPRIEGEGESLYFYDFDNHLFELHTGTLEQRLSQYSDYVTGER